MEKELAGLLGGVVPGKPARKKAPKKKAAKAATAAPKRGTPKKAAGGKGRAKKATTHMGHQAGEKAIGAAGEAVGCELVEGEVDGEQVYWVRLTTSPERTAAAFLEFEVVGDHGVCDIGWSPSAGMEDGSVLVKTGDGGENMYAVLAVAGPRNQMESADLGYIYYTCTEDALDKAADGGASIVVVRAASLPAADFVDGDQVNSREPKSGQSLPVIRLVSANPSADGATIQFAANGGTSGMVKVFDLRGRLVRTIQSSALSDGKGAIVWDGRTDVGQRAAAGVYMLQVEIGGRREVMRVVLLR